MSRVIIVYQHSGRAYGLLGLESWFNWPRELFNRHHFENRKTPPQRLDRWSNFLCLKILNRVANWTMHEFNIVNNLLIESLWCSITQYPLSEKPKNSKPFFLSYMNCGESMQHIGTNLRQSEAVSLLADLLESNETIVCSDSVGQRAT